MVILKFGGTSVASSKRILTLCEVVQKELPRKPVLVVSALSGVTDLLLALLNASKSNSGKIIKKLREIHVALIHELFINSQLHNEVLKYVDDKLVELNTLLRKKNKEASFSDQVISFGEILSSFLIAQALNEFGLKATQIIATDLIVTNDNFGSADFEPKVTEVQVKKFLSPLIKQGVIPVVTGFIGATKNGEVTTLGRGGSDYSASILGYTLRAREVQIWTDVDGVYTADPRVVKSAKVIDQISYKEASEMATFGAKVLHPRTIRPAIERNIPVRVLNTFKVDSPGTLITQNNGRSQGLKSIAFKRKATLINIYSTDMLFSKGYLAKIFNIFSEENISIDLVSVSEVSVSVTLDDHPRINNVVTKLKSFASVSHTNSVGMVSLIGEDLIQSTHVLTDVSILLHQYKIPIKMLSFGASNINISFVVDSDNIDKAVKLIHNQILLGNTESRIKKTHISGKIARGI